MHSTTTQPSPARTPEHRSQAGCEARAALTAPTGSRSSAPPARTAPARRQPPPRAGPSCSPAGTEGWARRCRGSCGPSRPGSAGRRELTGTWLWMRQRRRPRAPSRRPLSASLRGGAARDSREPSVTGRSRTQPSVTGRSRTEPSGSERGAATTGEQRKPRGSRAGLLAGPEGVNGGSGCSWVLPAFSAKTNTGLSFRCLTWVGVGTIPH